VYGYQNEQKAFLEVNPQFKTINIYSNRQGQKEKQGEGESNNIKQESKNESQKQSTADDTDEIPKAINKKRRKKSKISPLATGTAVALIYPNLIKLSNASKLNLIYYV